MPGVFRIASAFTLAAIFSPLAAHAAAPLEAYGKLPAIEQVQISPDGADVAVVVTNGEDRELMVQHLADRKLTNRLTVGAAKIRLIQWAGPEHIVITTSRTGVQGGLEGPRREYFLAFDFNLSTHKIRQLLTDVRNGLTSLAGMPMVRKVDGKPTVFVDGIYGNEGGELSVYRIDLDRDTSSMIQEGFPQTDAWLLDPNGAIVAQTTYDDRDHDWTLKVKAGAGWRQVKTIHAELETPALLGFGRDGHSLLVREFSDNAYHYHEVSPAGDWSEPLPIPEGAAPIADPETHRMIGVGGLAGDDERYVFFDPADQKVWDSLRATFKGQRVSLESWSTDRKKIAVKVDSPSEGPDYAIVDLTTRQATWLGGAYDTLKPEDISPVKPVRFKARDGMELTGYLTLPQGKDGRNLPLVMFPHGGPAARDEPGFDWWAQAMASRGYAVLQVEFRGSEGYGYDFLKAGFGQWGRKMQTDLSDGVRYLVAQGVADPKRVCIVGASYGGYAAMAGPTLDPGVYRCAVAYAGISDMRSFVPWVREQSGKESRHYVLRFIGAKDTSDPVLSEISPAAHVDKVNVPMLLIHGKDDTTVPIAQSRIMADALRSAGKPVEFVVLDSTDHWLTRGETRLAMLKAVVAFLEKNNPPN
ncbi:S9 family peptidase [Phenylobacterium sp.]|uniref:alpha/beta hydrolase family protein n=1 Tax=Phenylobacterium sp. TaxID=1871053 RepID=UPI002DED401B|nr:S9 family peptidase [Phenylobacterium sp.]